MKKEKANQWRVQFSHFMAVWTHQTNFWPPHLLSMENKSWGENWVQRKIQIILVGIKILCHWFITISHVFLVARVCPVFQVNGCDPSYSWMIPHICLFFFSLEYFSVSKAVWFVLLSIVVNSGTSVDFNNSGVAGEICVNFTLRWWSLQDQGYSLQFELYGEDWLCLI